MLVLPRYFPKQPEKRWEILKSPISPDITPRQRKFPRKFSIRHLDDARWGRQKFESVRREACGGRNNHRSGRGNLAGTSQAYQLPHKRERLREHRG